MCPSLKRARLWMPPTVALYNSTPCSPASSYAGRATFVCDRMSRNLSSIAKRLFGLAQKCHALLFCRKMKGTGRLSSVGTGLPQVFLL